MAAVTITDEIHEAMVELRDARRMPGRGRALYELNIWKGEQRRALDEEYQRRLAEIEAAPDPSLEDSVSPKILSLVAKASAQGVSRSNIRRALGKSSLADADQIISLAGGYLHEKIEQGEAPAFSLRTSGAVHAKGWPMYHVTLLEDGASHGEVYLVTSPNTQSVERRHLRIHPSPAGSSEILDRVYASGAAAEMFERGKA